MSRNIVVVGSLNADFVINLDRFPAPGETIAGTSFETFPGGKGGNQAYAAAQLGGEVLMLGQIGGDAQGIWLRNNLATAGVDVSHLLEDREVTSGVAFISIDHRGQNQIIIVPGANGTFSVAKLKQHQSVIERAQIVLLQLEIPLATVIEAARIAKQSGAVVMLDPAPAEKPLPDELLALVDYLTPNESELATLTDVGLSEAIDLREIGARARELIARGAAKVIVKLGGAGALFVSAESQHFWPSISVPIVDTTAAGDAFNAGFAIALAEGMSEEDAGRLATAAAACSVMRPGAQPSMPTRGEVDQLLKQHPPQ
ncbi:MAG: ribokinase [Pyrinomonadaceae bacterium]